jgi:hypothetical protein
VPVAANNKQKIEFDGSMSCGYRTNLAFPLDSVHLSFVKGFVDYIFLP